MIHVTQPSELNEHVCCTAHAKREASSQKRHKGWHKRRKKNLKQAVLTKEVKKTHSFYYVMKGCKGLFK